MKSVRLQNKYEYEYGVLGPDGRMHAWCNSWEGARADLYNCNYTFPGSEIVRLEEADDAPNEYPDVSLTYIADE